MTTYPALHAFNQTGLDLFRKVFLGQLPDVGVDPVSTELTAPVEGTGPIEVGAYRTAKEMAQSVIMSLGEANLHDLIPNAGMWAWLTFILRDRLFTRNADGTLRAGQAPRWLPTGASDYQNSNRHLVKMPVILLHEYGDDADHMLCGPPHEVPNIRRELTRQQDMFNRTFVKVARILYFDDASGGLKPRVGGESGGTIDRLAQVYRQLDVTWDIEELEPEAVLRKLPAEFDRFKPLDTA